jgi:hypothetical protein
MLLSALEERLRATVLEVWRQKSMFAKDGDLLFLSYRKKGKQPRFGSMIVEDYYSSCGNRCRGTGRTGRKMLLR